MNLYLNLLKGNWKINDSGMVNQLQANLVQIKKGSIFIGRSKKNQIEINDPFVSGTHCELFKLYGQENFFIRDLDSSNGTLILRDGKGVLVKKEIAPPLKNKDLIRIGNCEIRVIID